MSAIALPKTLELFLDAVNKGKVDEFLAFFPDDGVVNDWGRRFVGHDAIRRWSDGEFIGKAVSLKVTGMKQNGNRFEVMTQVGGKGFNGPSKFTFVLDGEAVREMRITEN